MSSDSLHRVTVLAMVLAAVLAGMGGGYVTGAVLSDEESASATFSAASNFDAGNQPSANDERAGAATTDTPSGSAGNAATASTATAGNRPTEASGNQPVGDSEVAGLSAASDPVHVEAREVE